MRTVLLLLLSIALALQCVRPQCTHPVFCSEPILAAVAKANIFPDSKSFVDLVLAVPVETALSHFLTLNVSEFVRLSFHPDPNVVLEATTFDDFQQDPPFLQRIRDAGLREFGRELHQRWNQLGKRVALARAVEVGSCRDRCTSFLEETDGRKILVPGGRFRESYYWDTYWIVLGLIASDML
jgi:alpha,alpha-trehalase